MGDERYDTFQRKSRAIDEGLANLARFQLPNREWAALGFGVKANGERRSAEHVLSVPNAELSAVEEAMADEELAHGWREGPKPEGPPLPPLGRESVEVRARSPRDHARLSSS